MIVCTPVTLDDRVGHRWGRAPTVVIAHVDNNVITAWERVNVSWDSLKDSGSEGSHHARIAKFLIKHDVDIVLASHMGDAMANMIHKLGIRLILEAEGDARMAALTASALN